jgi:hypothetical protein
MKCIRSLDGLCEELTFSRIPFHAAIVQSIRREAPKIGGSFAVWGGLFSTFDCTLVAIRKKGESIWIAWSLILDLMNQPFFF